MSDSPQPTDGREGDDPSADRVVIAVVRTGGIAGLRRRWQVEPPRAESRRWIALIESCPWDAASPERTGADRFVWSIVVRTPSERREQDLPDAALDGPWRELVDAVRAASR